MATRLRRKLGYEDYARIPHDGKRHEILDGELYVTPAPTPLHQRLSKRLQRRLEDHFEAQVSHRGIERAPLLIVEVLSPSTRAQDRGIKLRRYAALGVAHYWILDPDAETLECLRLESGAYRSIAEMQSPGTLIPPDWPDLVIDLGALWR